MTLKEKLALRKKLAVLEYAELSGKDYKSYRFSEMPHSTFYRWKKVFAEKGETGMIRS